MSWNKLTPREAHVIEDKGTEAPFSGEYDEFFEPGTYICRRCNTPLYRSEDKFNSGCGWPSFSRPAGEVEEQEELSHGMARTEVLCPDCGGHLGHVFDDGPAPTGERYCINSAAIDFEPRQP